MTVLSDATIREYIGSGDLVPGGNKKWAEECSYSFRPGRGFMAGEDGEPVEFQTPTGAASITVHPGKMVWIRTSDKVRIPEAIVGFWWQTNTLSRKGLMLVNMSMVEPGYEGDLACLFVNFGNGKVIIERDTVVAKMVFVDIRGTVAHPFGSQTSTTDYDAKLRELAANQPGSFLQVGDLAVDLSRQRDETIAELTRVGKDVQAEAVRELAAARADALNQFKEDAPKATWKAFGWAAAGFVLLTSATVAAGLIKDHAFSDGKEIARAEAETVIRDRITLNAVPSSAETVALRRQLQQVSERLAKLEKGKD